MIGLKAFNGKMSSNNQIAHGSLASKIDIASIKKYNSKILPLLSDKHGKSIKRALRYLKIDNEQLMQLVHDLQLDISPTSEQLKAAKFIYKLILDGDSSEPAKVNSEKDIPSKALEHIKMIGLPIDWERDDGFAYNGETASGVLISHMSNLIHESSHYQICTTERRRKPDFGLGDSPDSKERVKESVHPFHASIEEERASMLGIITELLLDLTPKWTYNYHGWTKGGVCPGRNSVQTIAWLIVNGFVNVCPDNSFAVTGKLDHLPRVVGSCDSSESSEL